MNERAKRVINWITWLLGPLLLLATASACAQDSDSAALKELKDQVQQLREAVRILQQEMSAVREALTPRRPSGWDKIENMSLTPEDSPQRGALDAPLVLFEFSDYQCPYCRRHYLDTFPEIERDFIAVGKLRYVIGEFPIPRLHPLAPKAAEAARCAGEQGKFWEMHARLFTYQQQLEPWSAHAQALGLDSARFQSCLDTGKYAAEVQRNAAQAQSAGIHSTPTFLLGIVEGQQVRIVSRLRGAAPYRYFKAEIEATLAESASVGKSAR
jgi:protein-disulfide isomerase